MKVKTYINSNKTKYCKKQNIKNLKKQQNFPLKMVAFYNQIHHEITAISHYLPLYIKQWHLHVTLEFQYSHLF